MELFIALAIFAVAVVVYVVVQMNSPSNRQARAANEALARVGVAWDLSPADERSHILSEAGIDSMSVRNSVIVQTWAQLGIQVKSAIALQSSLSEQFVGNTSTKDLSTPVATNQSVPETNNIAYFDAFFGLAMMLSRSLLMSEWETGIPQSYTREEASSIEATRQARSRLPYTTESRFVEEPLQRLLNEIGLIDSAREERTDSYNEWGPDLPPENLASITSTFLKAWLCNSNPFVLLELADFLIEAEHRGEAVEAIEVALKFPAYARTMTMSEYEMVAQTIAYELFRPCPGRDARSLSQGLYSPKALALLSEEAEAVRRKLDETEDSVEEQFPSGASMPMPTTPSEDQMKELHDAWKKGTLLEALKERDRQDLQDDPKTRSTRRND